MWKGTFLLELPFEIIQEIILTSTYTQHFDTNLLATVSILYDLKRRVLSLWSFEPVLRAVQLKFLVADDAKVQKT